MKISLVFSNIVINCSKGKHFLLCFILLWINFYNLRYITKVTPLSEPKSYSQFVLFPKGLYSRADQFMHQPLYIDVLIISILINLAQEFN